MAKKKGRSTDFTPELGDTICGLIAEGKSLRKIAELPEYPRVSTIMDWVLKGSRGVEPYVAFSEQYARAMDLRTEYWAEEIIDIADDDTEDRIFNEDGKLCINSEFIQRSKVKIDSRKWLMGKLKPKKYGEKLAVGGAEDLPPIKSEGKVTYAPEDAYKRMLDGGL